MRISEWKLKISDNVNSAMSRITGAADAASARFGKLQSNIDNTQRSFFSLRSVVTGLIGTLALGAFAKSSVAAWDEQSKANAQLQSVLISTKGIAGKTFDELEQRASDLQKITLFPDEQTMGAQSLLLTFTNVRGKIFNEAIPAIQDMATALHTDLRSASLMAGKALQDPERGITALRRAGVSFSDSQQEMIKKMVQGGDLVGAQTKILTELQKQFGGSAQAAAMAGLGPLEILKHRFDDVKESVGQMIVGGLNSLLQKGALLDILLNKLESGLKWVQENGPLIKDVLIGIAIGAGAMSAAWALLNINTIILTISTWALNLAFLANPITWVVLAIGALITAIVLLWRRSEQFRGFLYGLWEAVKQVFTNIWEAGKRYLGGLGELLVGIFTLDIGKIKSGLTDVFGSAKDLYFKAGKGVAEKFNAGYAEGSQEVKDKLALEAQEKATAKKKPGFSFKTPLADQVLQNDALKNGINNISEGGKQQRNITVNITKLVEALNINTTNLKEGAGDIKRQVEEILLRSINGAELAMRNE